MKGMKIQHTSPVKTETELPHSGNDPRRTSVGSLILLSCWCGGSDRVAPGVMPPYLISCPSWRKYLFFSWAARPPGSVD